MVQLMDGIANQHFGTGRSLEEFQAFGGYRDGEWHEEISDEVSIWIGQDESGEFYLGVAGRNVPGFDGQRYFRTAGFQEITADEYAALKACPVFQRQH